MDASTPPSVASVPPTSYPSSLWNPLLRSPEFHTDLLNGLRVIQDVTTEIAIPVNVNGLVAPTVTKTRTDRAVVPRATSSD